MFPQGPFKKEKKSFSKNSGSLSFWSQSNLGTKSARLGGVGHNAIKFWTHQSSDLLHPSLYGMYA
jgi:hypothetical protein